MDGSRFRRIIEIEFRKLKSKSISNTRVVNRVCPKFEMRYLKKTPRLIGFRRRFGRTIIASSRRTSLAMRLATSRQRNHAVVESSPGGCEPSRQIVWNLAVMWSRTKRLVGRRQQKIGQGRRFSLAGGPPSVSIVLSGIHQYAPEFSANIKNLLFPR